MEHWVAVWHDALDSVVVEDRGHDPAAWTAYLSWYLPRTRVRVVHVSR